MQSVNQLINQSIDHLIGKLCKAPSTRQGGLKGEIDQNEGEE